MYAMMMKLATTSEAEIRHQQMLAQTMRTATFSFLEKVKVKAGSSALCLNCGEGDVAFHLSGLVGKNGNAVGTDPSGENIHTAQQLAQIKNTGNVSFCKAENFGQWDGQKFDFIHCRLPLLRFFDPVTFIEEIRTQLVPGGVALFEVIDFSGFNSIPQNFAFERFLELYTDLARSQWRADSFGTRLNQLLSQSGFQQVQHQYVTPAFLRDTAKQLPSLTLECIWEEVLYHKLTSEDELQVLLYELKKFEQKAHAQISLPGIHQIWGQRA